MSSEQESGERPQSVSDALAWGIAELRRAGTDSPRLAAEVLLAHVLGWERVRLISHGGDLLPSGDMDRFKAIARRHAAGEPLQYLTGEREFFGLSFCVTPAVLIPRPETEILVEKAVVLARSHPGSARFADVGTGSGCIAVALAHEVPQAIGWATDLSGESVCVAQANARRLRVDARVAFARCDLLECFPVRPCFDLVLSNPPYISGDGMADLPGTIREHEPRLALFGGPKGLDIYHRLIPQAEARLASGGWLLLEVGAGQAEDVGALLERQGLNLEESLPDLQGIPRCLVARKL
jgi:release factor glutamine methyltransferase